VVGLRVEANGIIAVIDHGKGVAPADRNRIFERFWRKSDSDSGSGLGLAIAKDIMDAHGGRIWVEETPGGGATFKLSFPPAHPSKAKFSTPIQSGRSHENRRSFRRGDRR
ncbi:MAG TPA: HAMP domain-containing sensor histidine kinase, partial [Methylocystis sp.]|nr:HAMP domain-containing sensor histidine kinase [Methylocystis sp.]